MVEKSAPITAIPANLFMIRHVTTGEIMPLAKRNRGYSWWNPAKPRDTLVSWLTTPRVFTTREQAKKAILGWVSYPNSRLTFRYGSYGEEDYDFHDITPDGRLRTDLEIVEVRIEELK